MGIINVFFSMTGLNALLAAIALQLLEYENEAFYLWAIAILCFAAVLFLFFYKVYLLGTLKRDKTKNN